MRYISIQKKPTFCSELLMVFTNTLFIILIPYGTIIFTKIQNIFDKNKFI